MTSQEYCNYFNVPAQNCITSSSTPTNPPTDQQFLTLLYQRALDRQPDENGYNTWLSTMPPNTRANVVDFFVAPTSGQPPVQTEFDSKYGAFANSYCAGYSKPSAFTTPGVTIGTPTSITVTYVNNACGGVDMSSGQVIIGSNSSVGCDFIWTYTSSTGFFTLSSGNQNCAASGGGFTLMPNGNQNQSSVNINFTVSSSSLAGSQEVSSFAFDNQQVGTGYPEDLGSITIAGTSPDFGVNTQPQTIASSTAGGTFSGAWTLAAVTISPINGFNSPVALSFTNPSSWPAGLSVTALTEANNTIPFSVTTTSGTPGGTYTLAFNVSGGGTSHTGSVQLTISTSSFSIAWDHRLIPNDANGNVYAYMATYLTGTGIGGLQTALVNPAVTGPGGYSFSSTGCSPTSGSTPCSVQSSAFNLAQQGYGSYNFSASIYLYISGAVYAEAISDSKAYNSPSVTGISPNYITAGTSSVTITITGGSLGAPDLGASIYAGVKSVNVTTSSGAASGISASFSPTSFGMTYPYPVTGS